MEAFWRDSNSECRVLSVGFPRPFALVREPIAPGRQRGGEGVGWRKEAGGAGRGAGRGRAGGAGGRGRRHGTGRGRWAGPAAACTRRLQVRGRTVEAALPRRRRGCNPLGLRSPCASPRVLPGEVPARRGQAQCCISFRLPAICLPSLKRPGLTATKQPHQSGVISLKMCLIPDKLLGVYAEGRDSCSREAGWSSGSGVMPSPPGVQEPDLGAFHPAAPLD
nr:uncharacterized protein LOC115859881 [Globicephala melas]